MENPKRAGSIIELKVISELLSFGEVSIPYGNNARYDCILDYNGKLLRIQIKTAKELDSNRFKIKFANTRSSKEGSVRKVYTSDQVDYISTFYKNHLYLFPTGNHTNCMSISFSNPDNGLKETINLAHNFLAEKILTELN